MLWMQSIWSPWEKLAADADQDDGYEAWAAQHQESYERFYGQVSRSLLAQYFSLLFCEVSCPRALQQGEERGRERGDEKEAFPMYPVCSADWMGFLTGVQAQML